MSLVKKPPMTEKKLAALEINRKKSRGPSTAEGRERIRAAHLRHGFYSKSDEVALRALGEDPAKFRRLLDEFSNPATIGAALQRAFAHRLARAYWRMDRADRMQDGHALRQARQEESVREGRLHMQMMRVKMVSRSWHLLARSVARPFYVTTAADLKMMHHLHKDEEAKEMSEVAVSLFYQLREPGLPCPGDPNFEDLEDLAKAQRVVADVRAIFGIGMSQPRKAVSIAGAREGVSETPGPRHGVPIPIGQRDDDATAANVAPGFSPVADGPRPDAEGTIVTDPAQPEEEMAEPEIEEDEDSNGEFRTASCPSAIPDPPNPYPQITAAQWAAREPVRQLLENILSRQVQIFETQHHDLLRQTIAGPTPYERAAEIVPRSPDFELMQRMEYSNCRQLLRLSGLLIRLRRQELQMDVANDNDVSEDVIENNRG